MVATEERTARTASLLTAQGTDRPGELTTQGTGTTQDINGHGA